MVQEETFRRCVLGAHLFTAWVGLAVIALRGWSDADTDAGVVSGTVVAASWWDKVVGLSFSETHSIAIYVAGTTALPLSCCTALVWMRIRRTVGQYHILSHCSRNNPSTFDLLMLMLTGSQWGAPP